MTLDKDTAAFAWLDLAMKAIPAIVALIVGIAWLAVHEVARII